MNAQQVDSVANNKGFFLKITPMQIITGEFQMQLEEKNRRKGFELLVSYITKSSVNTEFTNAPEYGATADNYTRNGYRIGASVRFYVKNQTHRKGVYWNPVLTYKHVHYTFTQNYPDNGLNIRFTEANYDIGTLMCRYGKYVSIGNLFFDYYFGAGMKYKYGIAKVESSKPEVIISPERKLVSWIYPNFNLGFTIGYQFKHK